MLRADKADVQRVTPNCDENKRFSKRPDETAMLKLEAPFAINVVLDLPAMTLTVTSATP